MRTDAIDYKDGGPPHQSWRDRGPKGIDVFFRQSRRRRLLDGGARPILAVGGGARIALLWVRFFRLQRISRKRAAFQKPFPLILQTRHMALGFLSLIT